MFRIITLFSNSFSPPADLAVASRAVDEVASRATYALVTHPGHHASFSNCSGYCYINIAAVIAQLLRKKKGLRKVAVVDVDYHAGNGTIGIFWDDPDVFVGSIHAHPDIDYPYTCGFEEQIGGPQALGGICCKPLGQGASWDKDYRKSLNDIMEKVVAFEAEALVVSLGVDTMINDPVTVVGAGFKIELEDYFKVGATLRRVELPTYFVQEGGYDLDRVGIAVSNTLTGFCRGY